VLPSLTQAELAALYRKRLAGVRSMTEFKSADLDLADELESWSPRAARARYDDLPRHTTVRDREVEIDSDVVQEDGLTFGVARLRLPEKIARSLSEAELPALDRPLRFVVPRGQRGSVRAPTLDALQEQLDQPWTDEEVARFNRKRDEQRQAARAPARGARRGRGREERAGGDGRGGERERERGRGRGRGRGRPRR
jgi:hypothetical protein